MTSLPSFSVKNPVLINLFMVTILIGGVYYGLTLTREMFPESRPDQILVTTLYPGATPAEVEKGITLKIEEKVKDIEGVEKVVSIVGEGVSRIMVELESGNDDIEKALDDVKSAIDSIPLEDFPEDALETRVAQFEPKFPVIRISVSGDLDDRRLKDAAERLRTDILALPDVSTVTLTGTKKDEISVEVRPEKLIEYGLSFMDIADVIARTNLDLPGGQIRTPGAVVAVRTLGETDIGEELYDIVIRGDAAGRIVRLEDISTIVDGFEDVDLSGRLFTKPSATVTVSKSADQDAIKIAAQVRALVAGKTGQPLERDFGDAFLARLSGRDHIAEIYDAAAADPYPATVRLHAYADLSRYVSGRLDLLKRNGSWGLVFVFLSLLFFLHWRVAFWVIMGLVLAICGSLICMHFLGQTLNLITMFGLIVVLGLLVDDAIIVAEHVYTKLESGVESERAAIEGTEEVTWPVVCAITTTIVAFVPLMHIEGQIGDWIGVLPVIVCIALSVSLIEALTILPSHLAHGLRPIARNGNGDRARTAGPLGSLVRRIRQSQMRLFRRVFAARYERILRLATTNRYVTAACLVGGLLITFGVVGGGHVKRIFLQKMDSESVMVNLTMAIGTPIDRTLEAISVVEQAAMQLDELATLYTLLGAQFDDIGEVTTPQSHLAALFIELSGSEDRMRTSDEIIADLRRRSAGIPGVKRLAFEAIQGGPAGAPIQLEISGERIDDLLAAAEHYKRMLGQFDGVFDIQDDFDAGRREIQVALLDSGRALGITTDSLATQVRAAFYGLEARKVQRGREDVRIMVRYPSEFRRGVYDLESMYIATPTGTQVPLSEVATLTEGTGFSTIKRKNQRRTVTIKADVDDAVTDADTIMNEMLAPTFPEMRRRFPGMTMEFGGNNLENRKAFGSIKQSFVIALLLIYTILAALFKSYIQPLIVMCAIPFGLIGVVAGHYVMGYPMTIMSMIGMVALTGIVVNDSMILVTFINRLVANGTPPFEAVIAGGKGRLRAILLTSMTTVLGLAPLLAERSFQAKFLIPMGVAISGGLIFATVLTLLAVPAFYLIALDAKTLFAWIIGVGGQTEHGWGSGNTSGSERAAVL